MRTRVAQFDLQIPTDIWGLEGYGRALVLIRDAGEPLGHLSIPLRGKSVLAANELRQLASDNLEKITTPRKPPAQVSEPAITVVVCTRDRPLSLQRCLESLKRLRYQNFEVVVVDNASEGVDIRARVLRTPFRYVREERQGLDWARNRGLMEARNEIVAYTDDDAQVDEGWLQGIARGMQRSEVDCVTGLVCPSELETPAQLIFEQYGGMGKGLTEKLFDPTQMTPHDLIATHAIGVGANMAFRREALLKLGGFDVHLDVGTASNGGGDLDMFHRTLASGRAIWYEPTALVWHQHRRLMPGLHTQIYNNGRAFGCYLLKLATSRTLARTDVMHFAIQWIGSWLLGSLIRGGPGRSFMLVASEICGCVSSPWAYRKTYQKFPKF